MMENSFDLGGNDLVWRNKPELPAANEENTQLEETLRQKKIEIERLKLILQNNITKGKNMREHLSNLYQTLSYKQQLCKSKEHELDLEIHNGKLIERDCNRHEQEIKLLNQEIKTLNERQLRRQAAIADQTDKSDKLKSFIQWDEVALLKHLEESAQMERDNMALMKYACEDDSRINQLGLHLEKLSKEVYERKSALDDVDTEVFIVQSELDKMQDEFKNAYNERNNMVTNWEKVINQIQQRNAEINQLSEHILKMGDEEKILRQEEKEQVQLLSSETTRNDDLERLIRSKDNFSTKLHNLLKDAFTHEEELRAELTTSKNVSSNLLSQKQIAENNLLQFEKQLQQKNEKIESVTNSCKQIENEIEKLNKETFEADHYIKELENILQKENQKNAEIQKELENLSREILSYAKELKDLNFKEKHVDNLIKNCQADIRNLNTKIAAIDRLRAKQESEMYEIEANYEKVQMRIKKMIGVSNEQEKRLVEAQKAQLLSTLEEKKKALKMMTEEQKIMMENIIVSTKELENNKRLNSELGEKIKGLEFYILNSQKALKHSVSRKQELLVQECFVNFHMKRYKKLLNSRTKSVFTLQKSRAELDAMMKERIEELKSANDLLDAEIRSEEEECSMVKQKLLESDDRLEKLKSKYKIILDSLGISEPGESVEAEMLIKAEEEKRDFQFERDQLMTIVFRNEDELSALKNTLWMINAANEQFRQVVYPPGISLEDNETLRNTEEESQAVAIKLHISKGELKSLENSIEAKEEELMQSQADCEGLQDVIADREAEHEAMRKEIADVEAKMHRADRSNSRLDLDLRKKDNYSNLIEDIRIHLLREIRRTVSDMLFTTVESIPEISSKIQLLFQEANIPLPSRARSSLSTRSISVSSLYSRNSSKPSSPLSKTSSSSSNSRQSSRIGMVSPSVVMIGTSPSDSAESEGEK